MRKIARAAHRWDYFVLLFIIWWPRDWRQSQSQNQENLANLSIKQDPHLAWQISHEQQFPIGARISYAAAAADRPANRTTQINVSMRSSIGQLHMHRIVNHHRASRAELHRFAIFLLAKSLSLGFSLAIGLQLCYQVPLKLIIISANSKRFMR